MAIEPSNQTAVNPYAAPTAIVADVPDEEGQPAFFPVGVLKLAVMSLGTLGLYHVYWFYKNWKSLQQLTGNKVNAPLRALFYPLTSYYMFDGIRDEGRRLEVDVRIQAGAFAIVIFATALLWRLPDPYWLVAFAGVLPLLSVQAQVNKINGKVAPDAHANTRLSAWNIVAVTLGGLVLVLAMVGLFAGEAGAG